MHWQRRGGFPVGGWQLLLLLLLILQTSCWDKLEYQPWTSSSTGYGGTQIKSPSAKPLERCSWVQTASGEPFAWSLRIFFDSHAPDGWGGKRAHRYRYARTKKGRNKKKKREEKGRHRERRKEKRGDTKGREEGFQWIQVDMWCCDTGVRVLLDRREVLVSSLAQPKALPFWTRAEPVEHGSILQALPPFTPSLPPSLSSPSSRYSFPGPMGAVPRCWVNLLEQGKKKKREKAAKHLHVGFFFSPLLHFFPLIGKIHHSPLLHV